MTTRYCSDPECRGHDLDANSTEDWESTHVYSLLPPGATREQEEWADRLMGKHNGYPSCCIEEFIADKRLGGGVWARRAREFPGLNRCPTARPDLHVGYVPCRACARRLLGDAD